MASIPLPAASCLVSGEKNNATRLSAETAGGLPKTTARCKDTAAVQLSGVLRRIWIPSPDAAA